MSGKTVSISLSSASLLWLEACATTSGRRSLGEALNDILDQLRKGGTAQEVRSVRGTVELPKDDPDLEKAGETVRELFRRSLDRTAKLLDEPAATDA